MNDKNIAIRLLFLITTPKLADKAKAVLNNKKLPIQYMLHATGTATSDIMDTLGLGSIDKNILISFVPHNTVNDIFDGLSRELRFGSVNSGIAFTIPMTGASQRVIHMLEEINEEHGGCLDGKEDAKMVDEKYSMIAVIVNRGYTSDVMEAAKEAGASGGTVINSRRITDEEISSVWGLSVQEEKEIVMIVANGNDKVDIMRKISENCGMHSDARGIVMSFPIEDTIGLPKKTDK